MDTNINLSNFVVTSDKLCSTPFYIKNFNIPSININHPKISTRYTYGGYLCGDTLDFSSLELDILLDAKASAYFEILDWIFQHHKDKFEDETFTLNVRCFHENNNSTFFEFTFFGCRVSSLGNLNLENVIDNQSFTMSIVYDHFQYKLY